jgi:hypothetical protein
MKKLAVIGGVLVVVIVVVLFLTLSNLGPIIKKAVNTYGPRITKTEIRLDEVDVSIFSGQAQLKDFSLGNPKGFSTAKAMDVGSIFVDVEEGSLTKDTIIIQKIDVVRPVITYEKTRGTDNFNAILANVQEAVGDGKPGKKEPSAEKGPAKKIMIQEFILEGGQVNLATSLVPGKTVSASIPDIHLKDIGTKEEGITAAAAFEKILSAVYARIQAPAVMEKLNEALGQIREEAKALQEKAEKEVEAAKSAAKKEAEAVQERAEKKVQEETDKAKQDVKEKLKGLLGN